MTEVVAPAETREIRLKRLRLRSWRRGTREMDLLLGGFADQGMARLDEAQLDAYEAMMDVADQDLYSWISGQAEVDPRHAEAIAIVRAFHKIG